MVGSVNKTESEVISIRLASEENHAISQMAYEYYTNKSDLMKSIIFWVMANPQLIKEEFKKNRLSEINKRFGEKYFNKILRDKLLSLAKDREEQIKLVDDWTESLFKLMKAKVGNEMINQHIEEGFAMMLHSDIPEKLVEDVLEMVSTFSPHKKPVLLKKLQERKIEIIEEKKLYLLKKGVAPKLLGEHKVKRVAKRNIVKSRLKLRHLSDQSRKQELIRQEPEKIISCDVRKQKVSVKGDYDYGETNFTNES